MKVARNTVGANFKSLNARHVALVWRDTSWNQDVAVSLAVLVDVGAHSRPVVMASDLDGDAAAMSVDDLKVPVSVVIIPKFVSFLLLAVLGSGSGVDVRENDELAVR